MKTFFLDVGQGTSQVIHLGERRAIVIDTGSHPGILLRTLRLLRIEVIDLLVISHSHADHSGGAARREKSSAAGLLVDYLGAIERIAFVHDSDLLSRPFGKELVRQLRAKLLLKEQLVHVEASAKPQQLWPKPDQTTGGTVLAAISPLAGDTLLALDERRPNATSVVLELRHRGNRVIFAADSEISQWRDIMRLRNLNTPMECSVLTIPHHGGLMSGTAYDRSWFLSSAVRAEVVVFSVGTTNQHKHPRPEVVTEVANTGAHVICTQITKQCCDDLESVRPGVIGPMLYPCRSSSNPDFVRKYKVVGGQKRRFHTSRNVACGGTVVARIDKNGIHVERLNEHRRGVDKLTQLGAIPLCRQ